MTESRYKEFAQLDLPGLEKEILAKWEREKAFEASVELREGARPFVFYEGPPSANGMPGRKAVLNRPSASDVHGPQSPFWSCVRRRWRIVVRAGSPEMAML
jgi:hypothetical protein